MGYRILILFSIFLTTVLSCKEQKNTGAITEQNQMKEVMAIHDELMPDMSKASRLAGQLKSKIDTTTKSIEYQKAIRDLQAANESMMEWMQDFADHFDSDEIMNGKELSDEKKKILTIEEEKIKALDEKYKASIAKAEVLLKE